MVQEPLERGICACSAGGVYSDHLFGRWDIAVSTDWNKKEYLSIPVEEQVASLTGDVAISPGGNPAVHVHAKLGIFVPTEAPPDP